MAAVRAYVGKQVKIMAVVKANGYGHGILPVSRTAVDCGAAYLGVARIEEAMELRTAGFVVPILVFEVVRAQMLDTAIAHRIELSVSSSRGAGIIDYAAGRGDTKALVHVKVDTGMGRLGIDHRAAVALIESVARSKSLVLAGVYSHFATSEQPDKTFAGVQLDRFQAVMQELQRRRIDVPLSHMANSGAIISLPDSHFTMVRPGIMLYGYTPGNGMDSPYSLKPVLSLLSTVSLIKNVGKGMGISYGQKFVTTQPTRIATVPIGYGDGYPRMLTGKADVLIRGKRYPVVGTICMDHVMVDVGEDSAVEEGDEVTLIGRSERETISAWDIAGRLGTIPYEVTCMINQRVPRVCTGEK